MQDIEIVFTNNSAAADYLARNLARYNPGIPVPEELGCYVGQLAPLTFIQ